MIKLPNMSILHPGPCLSWGWKKSKSCLDWLTLDAFFFLPSSAFIGCALVFDSALASALAFAFAFALGFALAFALGFALGSVGGIFPSALGFSCLLFFFVGGGGAPLSVLQKSCLLRKYSVFSSALFHIFAATRSGVSALLL